jgi:hypothetical protein
MECYDFSRRDFTLHTGGIGCQSRATTSRDGWHRRFVIEAETRRSPVGGKSCSGPPTRTPGNRILPAATTELIDVHTPLCGANPPAAHRRGGSWALEDELEQLRSLHQAARDPAVLDRDRPDRRAAPALRGRLLRLSAVYLGQAAAPRRPCRFAVAATVKGPIGREFATAVARNLAHSITPHNAGRKFSEMIQSRAWLGRGMPFRRNAMAMLECVRRQSFWDRQWLKIRESLAPLVCNVMRLAVGAASGDWRLSVV